MSDPFAALLERHERTTHTNKSLVRGRARKLAAELGVTPPAWASMVDQTLAVGREERYSARERRALACFRRGGSMRAIAAALGVSDIDAIERWIDGPTRAAAPLPGTFADAERAEAAE